MSDKKFYSLLIAITSLIIATIYSAHFYINNVFATDCTAIMMGAPETIRKDVPNEPHPQIIITESVPVTTEFIEETPVTTETEEKLPVYIVTEDEREMLARLTWLEAGICSFECQVSVVSVVFNRFDSGKWTKDMNGDTAITLYDIIHYPHAFTPAYKIPYVEPSQSCYDAVDFVLQNGSVFHQGVRYFRINYDFDWPDYNNFCTIDNVYFGYFNGWENGGW